MEQKIDNSTSQKPNAAPENQFSQKPSTNHGSAEPGSGIRSMRTTTAFRVVNFELYAKPNYFTMALGVSLFTGCIGYLTYLNYKQRKENTYTTINLDGTLTTRPKTSKWD